MNILPINIKIAYSWQIQIKKEKIRLINWGFGPTEFV